MKCIQTLVTLWLVQQGSSRTHGVFPERTRDQPASTDQRQGLRESRTEPAPVDDSPRGDDEFRIVGGTNAPSGKYPYMVKGGGCGASVIAPNLLLTAAHCQGTFGGTLRIGSINSNSGGETATATTQIVHPNYAGSNNDFMIIKLSKNVQATPVQLNANANSPSVNDPLTVIGFGRTSEGGSSSSRLKEVTVPYVSHQKCRSVYGSTIQESTMLCAGTDSGGKDSCQGDSGGPIVNSAGVQVGVVSFGSGCARPGVPGVYARTSGAIDWINQVICTQSSSGCAGDGGGGGGDGDDGGSDGNVRVEVTHDGYPEDTGWTVKNANGNTVMSQGTATVKEAFAVANKSGDLPDGKYTFQITDSWGDGICCQYGNGGIKIYNGNSVVAQDGGQFSSSKSLSFTIGSGDGGGGGSSGDTEVRVEVKHDGYPEDTGWKVRNSSGQVVMRQVTADVKEAFALATETEDLPAGSYTFEISDSWGDGICCQYGNGGVEIYVDNQKIAEDNGQFGNGKTLNFSVSSRSDVATNATETMPTAKCTDSTSTAFLVSEEVGEKECSWLASNLDHFDYLCNFVTVASACPKSCGDCSIFK